MNNQEKKYIGEVLQYDKHIAPYFFIEIDAGVGAGKTHWIETLANDLSFPDEGEGHKARILFVTSRRAKVEETFTTYEEKKLFAKSIGIPYELASEFNDYFWGSEQCTVCTNAFIENYLRKCYKPNDEKTWLWETFDMIVVDEVHSLILDATYQSAPFHVYDLLNMCIEVKLTENREKEIFGDDLHVMRCKHIIVMTGTPDPLRRITFYGMKPIRYDLMSKCKNVSPNHICFIEKKDLNEEFQIAYYFSFRAVYFKNEIVFPKEFCEQMDIPPKGIACSFSKAKKRKELKSKDKEAFEAMERVESSLKKDCVIPDDIDIFVTTSRYKEGININNDVDYMYVEAHNQSDVVQMAGRARRGVDYLNIVVDAEGYSSNDKWRKEEILFTNTQLVQRDISDDEVKKEMQEKHYSSAANEFLQYCLERCGKASDEEKNSVKLRTIEYLEEKFPYIKYSYLHERFMYYGLKEIGNNYIEDSEKIWSRCKSNPLELKELVQKWFPESEVLDYVSKRSATNVEMGKEALHFWTTWKGTGVKIDTEYSWEEKESILSGLKAIYIKHNSEAGAPKRMDSALNRLGFKHIKCFEVSGNKHSNKYRRFVFKNIMGELKI